MLREQLQLKVNFISKPSAFEGEIHPSHKTSFCTLCISLCELSRHKADVFARRVPMHSLTGKFTTHISSILSVLFPKSKLGKEEIAMPRNSFVQMSKLHNVRGRIYYISSDKKQENLYAVYETTDRKFWTELCQVQSGRI